MNKPEPGHKVGTGWPSWWYPPDGGPGAIFDRAGDVPSGWAGRPTRKKTLEEIVAENTRKTTVVIPKKGLNPRLRKSGLVIPEGVEAPPEKEPVIEIPKDTIKARAKVMEKAKTLHDPNPEASEDFGDEFEDRGE